MRFCSVWGTQAGVCDVIEKCLLMRPLGSFGVITQPRFGTKYVGIVSCTQASLPTWTGPHGGKMSRNGGAESYLYCFLFKQLPHGPSVAHTTLL